MGDRHTHTTPSAEAGWLVITSYDQKVVAEYPTRKEAEDAAKWYMATWPHSVSLEVCRAAWSP
jgi:hypothetical protein